MSASSIKAAQALLASRLDAIAVSGKVSKAKTRKGQQSARKAEQSRPAVVETVANLNGWVPPMSFKEWLATEGLPVVQKSQASDEVVAGYTAYVSERFAEPITFGDGSSFNKVVMKQVRNERVGKANLGLLGYSADDIGARAVMDAFADAWQAYLLTVDASQHLDYSHDPETGDAVTCVCFACEVKRALSDRRTDEHLLADASQYTTPRYEWEAEYSNGAGRMRTRTPLKAAVKARTRYETRLALYQYIASNDVPLLYPTVGATYRKVGAVIKEGLREFSNTVEGLTPDGLLTDDLSYIGGHRHDLVESGYDKAIIRLDRSVTKDEAFTYYGYSERTLNRNAVMDYLLSRENLLPAEVKALTALDLLNKGYTIAEVLEVFEYKRASSLNGLIRDAQAIIAEAHESDMLTVYKERALAEMLTQAVGDAITE